MQANPTKLAVLQGGKSSRIVILTMSKSSFGGKSLLFHLLFVLLLGLSLPTPITSLHYSPTTTRRAFSATLLTTTATLPPFLSFAAEQTPPPSLTVAVSAPSDFANPPPASALYITARPNTSDDVPQAILSGTRGKPPPVLTRRVSSPTFPTTVTLDANNLTAEGAAGEYWYSKPLIVSARWDSDGVAATRSPEDLVGRALYQPSSTSSPPPTIALRGRGPTGKLLTSQNKPPT